MTDDLRFDRMLEESLNDLPPDHAQMQEINPWRQAMKRIIWGIGLTTLTLNFWYLNYILPALGTVLTVLGYRALRRENRYFRVCWLISLYSAAVKFIDLVLNATVIRLEAMNPLTWVSLALGFVQGFCLWQGIRAVRRKAGQPDSAGAAVALMVWEAVIVVLGLSGADGWFFMLPLLIAYICILRSLGRIPSLLDEAGYEIAPAPVRVPDAVVKVIWFTALLTCIAVAGALYSRYPMEWEPVDEQEHAGYEEIIDRLERQGLPEEVIADLTGEELERLRDSICVVVRKNYNNFSGRRVGETEASVCFTHAAILLPEERWVVIHHFRWLEEPTIRTTECIKLWTAHENDTYGGYRSDGGVTGRLLYDWGGTTFTGDYYSLTTQTNTTQSFFGLGGETSTDPYALFSLPMKGKNCRGYLIYGVTMLGEGWLFNSWNNYTHQISPVVYPLMTAEEYEKSGMWNGHGAFYTAQEALQFRPSELKSGHDYFD